MSKARLDALRTSISDLGLDLLPPISERDLVRWERSQRVTLPDEYRRFLLDIGEGGDGPPELLLWPLRMGVMPRAEEGDDDDFDEWFRSKDALKYLRQPFPLTKAWDWEHDEEGLGESDRDDLQFGSLVLGTDGCTSFWHLVVTGAARGQVWFKDGVTEMKPVGPDFLSWYRTWVDRRLDRRKARAKAAKMKKARARTKPTRTATTRRRSAH